MIPIPLPYCDIIRLAETRKAGAFFKRLRKIYNNLIAIVGKAPSIIGLPRRVSQQPQQYGL
jgi:hypothetical protein